MDGVVYWLELVVGDVWMVWYTGFELFIGNLWMVWYTGLELFVGDV